MRVTPEQITHLEKNEVFVFGSNLAGAHGGGAVWVAYRKFSAVWGQGVGLQGQSYATSNTQNDGDVSETKLTKRQQKKLNLIKGKPTNTGKQMSETLSVSQCTIEYDLNVLQVSDILKHEGKGNDGVWVIEY